MSQEVDEKKEKVSSFEDLMALVGTTGWRNYLIFLAASVSSMVTALPIFSYQFLGGTPKHWCHVEQLVNSNWTDNQIKEIAIPFIQSDGEYSQCEMYALDYSSMASFEEIQEEVKTGRILRNNTLYCSSRDFEDHVETIVNAWDLVCERRVLYSTTQAAVQGGMLVGSLVIGYLIDRFGRNFMYRICVILFISVGFITALSPNIFVFILLRVLIALSGIGMYMAIFVMCMEISSTKQRSLVGSYVVLPWALGMMLTSGIAYGIRPWKLLQVALTVPALSLLLTFWILPESPRWLILTGRHKDALAILKTIAASNKREILSDENFLDHMKTIQNINAPPEDNTESDPFSAKLIRFVRHVFYMLLDPHLRLQTLGIFFCWFSVAMVYYGVSLASSTLHTDAYLYIFLSGLVEIPAYLIVWPAAVFLGRRKSLMVFYFTCAGSILAAMALVLADQSNDYSTLRLMLFLIGKLAITAAFQLIWMYTAEIYPTKFRSLIMGESSAAGRIGSICSPYINDLLVKASSWSPSALFGGVSVIAGIITIIFPEPSGKDLPDSVENLTETEAL